MSERKEGRTMKRSGILHPELAFRIASCGHGDLVCIADAGLPIPPETPRIDLAYALGQPGFFNVLEAILPELAIEGAVWAEEALARSPMLAGRLETLFQQTPHERIPHEEFKKLLPDVRFVVRTGECTPYANVLLRCGVPF